MPSLQQLEEFASSFKNIGREISILTAGQQPYDELPLPENEPPAPFPDELSGNPALSAPPATPPGDAGDMEDFAFPDLDGGVDDLLSGMGDLTGTPVGDLPAPGPGGESPGADLGDFGGFGLDGEAGFDLGGEAGTESPGTDLGDFGGFDGEAGLDLGGEAGTESPGADLGDFGGFDGEAGLDLGGEAGTESSGADLGDFGLNGDAGLDLGGEAGTESPGADLGDFGLDGDAGLDLGGEAGTESPGADLGDFGLNGDAGLDLGGEAGTESPGADLGDFGLNGDAGLDLGGEAGPESPGADLGDFGLDGDAGLDLGGEAGTESPGADLGDFGLDGDAGLDLGGEAGPESSGADLGDFGLDGDAGFDLGGEAGPESPGVDTGDFGLDGEAGFDLGGEAGPESPGDFGLDGDAGFDLGGETGPESPGADPGDFSGFDGEAGLDLGGEAGTESPGDSFDNFSLGDGGAQLDTPDFDTPEDFSASAFSLDGFDEQPSSGKTAARPSPAAADAEVEEIKLNEDEFRRLQETLSSYPLNLRIACEEIIAEQAVAPEFMSALIKLLTRGAPAKETAALAGKILGRGITIPKGFAKQTGAELEEEQASFGYIFVKKFLPVLRIFIFAALALFVTGYLAWRFIVNPLIANGIYKDGYERIFDGDYNRANDLFIQAFDRHPVKNWFYRYAEAFRDVRHYQFAERKYDELLRVYPRDKKGALDYAALETHYLKNYEKADRILRTNILDYAVDDREGLLALGENNLAWGEERPEHYEDARAAYARLIARYGRQDPFMEGMLKYFIRTDKLNEVLPLQAHFMNKRKKRKIAVSTLSELGGYLLDKRLEEARGVPDEYVESIEGIRDILLRAIKEGPALPEAYYHLARYYNRYGTGNDERATLESAIRIFETADEDSAKRAGYRVDAHRRYAEVLVNAGEFFPAAEQLSRGIRLYEDARARDVLRAAPEFGRLYADMGDLVFYGQDGDMEAALRHYAGAEANGWSPPEIQYRIGAAHYELQQWEEALGRFFTLSPAAPNNRRLLYALGNISYLRGNYFAAQSYYSRLLDLLDAARARFPNLTPGSGPEEQDLAERIMVADNNLGVTLEALTRVSGDTGYRSRALGLFAESIRAWDMLTRDPQTMSRSRPIRDLYGPGINLAYLNAQNILRPIPGYEQQIFMRIDRDMMEPSAWELLVPRDYRLSENLYSEQPRPAAY